MIDIFNNSVDTERFSMTDVYNTIVNSEKYNKIQKKIVEKFSDSETKDIFKSIIRFSFYIEPVKVPKIESTKFTVRWSERLTDDFRFSSFDNCTKIFDKLLEQFISDTEIERNKQLIQLILHHSLISYELNIDYINRITNNSIHSIDNIAFFWGQLTSQVYSLRKYLLNPNNHNYIVFFKAVYEKIAVKSFLTDRVLTGLHKTNREKRWECHTESVHFALRKECLSIENKLIKQICDFQNFPTDLKRILIKNNIIESTNEVTKCPITLEPISFTAFNDEVLNPVHGKSTVQVGHNHPLKSTLENQFSGHTADNISWISSVGNRIQGELSVDETRDLILKIIENYKKAGFVD